MVILEIDWYFVGIQDILGLATEDSMQDNVGFMSFFVKKEKKI